MDAKIYDFPDRQAELARRHREYVSALQAVRLLSEPGIIDTRELADPTSPAIEYLGDPSPPKGAA